MWSNVIGIDKEWNRELEYVLKKLAGYKQLSYAVEENEKRVWIYIACACECHEDIERKMYDMLEQVFLSFFKLRFYKERLNMATVDFAKCALLSSILHFDRAYECNVIDKMLSCTLDYNIDGLYNFRMKALKDSWGEVAEVASRLLYGVESEQDVFDVANFIAGSDGKKNVLVLEEGVLSNITERCAVEILNVYDDVELNLLDAIIRSKPSDIQIINTCLSGKMLATLRKIARVAEKS